MFCDKNHLFKAVGAYKSAVVNGVRSVWSLDFWTAVPIKVCTTLDKLSGLHFAPNPCMKSKPIRRDSKLLNAKVYGEQL